MIFVNVIHKYDVIQCDPQVRIRISNMLYRYNRLPPKYQSKTGYDFLIQNVILTKLINILGATITDLDLELKMKISRINFLESKKIL